jgi:ribonuclease PH
MRPNNRPEDSLRNVKIETDINDYAEGACLITFGKTRVICTASLDDRVPPFLKNTGKGWITAEYGMLPRATGTRTQREAAKGKQGGRTIEIQRLIGRSLRAVCDLQKLGEKQITIDCDVIHADGGTRTASITGGYVALQMAVQKMLRMNLLKQNPIKEGVAAVSAGIVGGNAALDLEYLEDSVAEVDANFVITESGKLVEIQCSAEGGVFDENQYNKMLGLAKKGISELIEIQKEAL